MRLAGTKLAANHQYRGFGDQLYDLSGQRPSLDLNFAGSKSLVDATTGQNLVTFTRASSGTFVGSDGLIKTATTNLLLRSEEFDNASWTKTRSSVTADAITAPNGTTTADTLIEDSSASATHFISQGVSITSGTNYAFSVFIKRASGSRNVNLRWSGGFDGGNMTVDLTTGAVTASSAIQNPSATAFSNGWWRVSFRQAATSTGTFGPQIFLHDGTGISYTGNGTSGVYLWGAQLEQSSTVGEYIPTTSTINSAPRFDHNPTTGESLGLLVEEQRTNLAFPSNMPTSVVQTTTGNMQANGATQITSGVPAPDSSTNGFTVSGASATTNSSGSNNVRILSVMAAAGTHTVSMWIKTNSSSTTVTIRDATTSTGIGFVTTSSWTRITATFNNTSAGNIILLSTSGTAFDCFGVQVESGSFPTSYIPTTTATVTRSADVVSITGANFSSWYRQDEGTVFSDCVSTNAATQILVNIGATAANTGSSSITIASNLSSSQKRVRVRDAASVDQASLALGASSSGSRTRIAAAIKADDFAASLDGGAALTDTTGTVPTVALMEIGSAPSGVSLGTQLHRRLTYWPQRLANEVLQRITQ
jgi:hypothetical protein